MRREFIAVFATELNGGIMEKARATSPLAEAVDQHEVAVTDIGLCVENIPAIV
jgi:hypothetical protein